MEGVEGAPRREQPYLWTKLLSLGTDNRPSFPIPRPAAVIHAPTHSQSPTQQRASTRELPVVHRIHIPYDDDYLFSFINNYTTFTDVPVDISPSLRQSPFVVGVFGETHQSTRR